jgi:2-keto-4-pentenoate hydratase/2-oxohepta-3-ene-1,7-dioic acid hydratase in catechol pathway
MRLGTARIRQTAPRAIGALKGDDDFAIDLNEAALDFGLISGTFPKTILELLEFGSYGEALVRDIEERATARGDLSSAPWAFSTAEIEFLSPVPRPGKLLMVGGNRKIAGQPLDPDIQDVWPRAQYFEKASTSVIGHGATVLAWEPMRPVQIEGEIAVIISRTARHVKAADAWKYIAGVSLLNDMSAGRFGLQDGVVLMINRGVGVPPEEMITRNMTRAKNPDGYCPIGPWLIPESDLSTPFEDVEVTTQVGKDIVQHGKVSEYGFSAGECLEEITQWITLDPGDVVSLGCFKQIPEFPLRLVDAASPGREKLIVFSPQLGRLETTVKLVG